MRICSCCLLKNRKNECYLVINLVICSNMTTLHASQATRHQLVSLGTASKNPLEVTVQVPECTEFCNMFFSAKETLFHSTSSLKGVENHKLMPRTPTTQLMNEMSGQLEYQDHPIFSCVLPFALRQSCHKCVSAALWIASEIPTVGYSKGTTCFLSRCVTAPGEELFAFSARGKEERIY